MRSYLEAIEVYDPRKRYLFTNWSDEDFSQSFLPETRAVQAGSREEDREVTPRYTLTVKAGETVEMSQFEAVTCVRHFVDREIDKEVSKLPESVKSKHYLAVGNPDMRKPYEDKTIREIGGSEAGSAFIDSLREQIRAEERAKMQAEVSEVKSEEKPKEKVAKNKEKEIKEPSNEEFGGLAS